jgi:hypothetical protein
MKKLAKILTPFLLLNCITLTGCKKEDKRVLLSFGDVHATESRLVDLNYLQNVIDAKENFVLAVSTNACGCWDSFKDSLNPYLKKNKVCCYQITFNQISNRDIAAHYELLMTSKSTTTFAIYENGKLKTYLNSSKDSKIMDDKAQFAKYMEENVILPKCFFINKNDVETIKNSGKNAVIYFERNGCGDCSAINPGILRNYVKNHEKMKQIYVLDCEDYWRPGAVKPEIDDPDYETKNQAYEEYRGYLDVKNELGLAETTDPAHDLGEANNPVYGFGSGVFPFFSFIKNKEYSSGCVVYNDSVQKEDGKYKVTNSYYTTERVEKLQYTNTVIKGKVLPASHVNDHGAWVEWKHEKADIIYEDILNSFLDYALPKTNFTF